MITLTIISLSSIGLIVWLIFLLKPITPQKKPISKKKEVQKKKPRRKLKEVKPQPKLDEFITMNPKYATELIRSWLNQRK